MCPCNLSSRAAHRVGALKLQRGHIPAATATRWESQVTSNRICTSPEAFKLYRKQIIGAVLWPDQCNFPSSTKKILETLQSPSHRFIRPTLLNTCHPHYVCVWTRLIKVRSPTVQRLPVLQHLQPGSWCLGRLKMPDLQLQWSSISWHPWKRAPLTWYARSKSHFFFFF